MIDWFKKKRKQMLRNYQGKNPYAIGELIRDKQEVLEILDVGVDVAQPGADKTVGITYPITDVIEEIPVKE